MNVLIFSVSIGNGHDQVAHTLRDAFLLSDPQNDVRIINTISLISPLLDKVILDSYLNILKFYPKAWGKIYEKTNKLDPIIDINDITNKLKSSKLKRSIVDSKPDVIFCTHSFPSSIMASLKEKGFIHSPLISVITDYNIHSSYINDVTDYYVVAHESLIPSILSYDVDINKVLPFGIPIKSEFSMKPDKKEILNKLELKDKTTMLVMGGGLGLGSINGIVKEIDDKFDNIQIIAITGRNKRLESGLKSISAKNDLIIYGFVPNVHELIEISDFIISKPGGVTCAEIITKEKPLIIYSPLPGQESDNADFLLNYGVAVKATYVNKIPYLIKNILNLDLKIKSIKDISAFLKKPNAAKEIISFVEKTYKYSI